MSSVEGIKEMSREPDRLKLETCDQDLGMLLFNNKAAKLQIQIGNHASTWSVVRWSHQCLGVDCWTIELQRVEKL